MYLSGLEKYKRTSKHLASLGKRERVDAYCIRTDMNRLYIYPSFTSITTLTVIHEVWEEGGKGFKIQLLSFLKNESTIRNFNFFLLFSGLITTTGRKLDRETESEHILEVIFFFQLYTLFECGFSSSNGFSRCYKILETIHKTDKIAIYCQVCIRHVDYDVKGCEYTFIEL